MKKALLNIIFIVSFVFMPCLSLAIPTTEEYGVIINLSGRQRMLTQKMMKEAFLIYVDIDIEKNRNNLKETRGLFVKILGALHDGDSSLKLPPTASGAIKAQIDSVNLLFKNINYILERIIAGEMPSRDAILELAENNPVLLKNMNTIVEMYEQEARNVLSGNETFLGIEINLAGKQRMLTQKMTKEALLIYLGVDSRKNKRLLRETCALFDKTLKGLKYGDGDLGLPYTMEENIIGQLDFVIKIWGELRPIVEKSSDIMLDKISKEELETVARLNVLLLTEMDKTVRMYEDLSR